MAEKNGLKIITECKLYEKSFLNLTALIHEWSSKKETAGADKILIVVGGVGVLPKHYKIAKEKGVYIWDEEFIHSLNEIESNKKLYEKIGTSLEFKEIMAKLEIKKEKRWKEELERRRKREEERKRKNEEKDKQFRQRQREEAKKRREEELRRKRKKGIIIVILGIIVIASILLPELLFEKTYDESVIGAVNGNLPNRDITNIETENFCRQFCGEKELYTCAYHEGTSLLSVYCSGFQAYFDSRTKEEISLKETRNRNDYWNSLQVQE